MNVHEFQAVELFRQYGIPVPTFRVADNLNDALLSAKKIGFPVVLKAQVLAGGRGKAGGIKKVKDDKELKDALSKIMGMEIKGFIVNKILVSQAIKIKNEIYLGITLDKANGDIVIIASKKGGVDIEDTAKQSPHDIFKLFVNRKKEIGKTIFSKFLSQIFDNSEDKDTGIGVLSKLLKLFIEKDCTLVEINPYAQNTENKWFAVDAKINFDDNALFRHPELESLRDISTEDEDEVFAHNSGLSFVKLEGEIGCIVNGAGLAMATMDAIKNLGGKPLNFLDVGGSSNPKKVINALKIILKNPKVKAILINIFGGITRCDDIANGIIEAHRQIDIKVPLVVRLTGTNEAAAKEILSQKGIKTFTQMKEAVERVVAL